MGLFNRRIVSKISVFEKLKCLPKLLCNAGEPMFRIAKRQGLIVLRRTLPVRARQLTS